MKYVFLGILALIVVLVAVVLLRAALLKPTKAKNAKLPEADAKRSMEYAKTLSEMIKVETVSDRDNFDISKYYRYHDRLKELFPLTFSTLEVTDIDGSLIAKWKGKTDGDAILLMSHQDVVAANGVWKHDPFGGEIADGAVWGRGAVDTKGSGFCFLQAVEELIREGYEPETDIYLAGSCTEEISGNGAEKTVEWLKKNNVRLSLVLDEGGMIVQKPVAGVNGTYAMIGVLEKGYGDLKFTARGKGGHASAPTKGTPWARLAGFINEIEKKDPFKSKFSKSVNEMFSRLAPNMDFGMRVIFANLWLFRPLLSKVMGSVSAQGGAMIKTTVAFTKGQGSEGYNVLPAEAYVTANMRFINHQNAKDSIELISGIAKKYDIETEVLQAKEPSQPISYKGNAFKLVEKAVTQVFPGFDTVPYVMTVGTDAKDYEVICDNCLRFAPLCISDEQMDSIHAENENIDINSLPFGVDFFKVLIKNSKDAQA